MLKIEIDGIIQIKLAACGIQLQLQGCLAYINQISTVAQATLPECLGGSLNGIIFLVVRERAIKILRRMIFMTRKKSNVKALALAVTCAILAGGVQASPVSAAVNLYKDASTGDVTTNAKNGTNDNYQIFEIESGLTIGGVKIGGKDAASGVLEVKEILGISNNGSVSDVKINGATFASDGAITASKLALGTGSEAISDVAAAIKGKANASDLGSLQDAINTADQKIVGITRSGDDSNGYTTTIEDKLVAEKDIAVAGKITDANGQNGVNVQSIAYAVNAVDNTKKGTLAYNTQKIEYNGDSKFTQINGALKIVTTDDSSARLILDESSISAEKLGAIDRAVNVNGNTTSINAKLDGSYGSKIGDVTFNKDGKISGVQDINDGFVKIQPASTDNNKTALQVNGVLELNDNTLGNAGTATLTLDGLSKLNNLVKSDASEKTVIYAGNGSTVGGVKFNDGNISGIKNIQSSYNDSTQDIVFKRDASTFNNTTTIESTLSVSEKTAEGNYGNVAINTGEINQVLIGEEGLVVGLNSSVVNDDGVFTGGHNYDNAKAAMRNSDGAIKGAGGKFTVDADGAITGANGKFKVDKDGNTIIGGTLGVTGATTLSSTLEVTGKTTLKDNLEVAKDATVTGTLSAASGKFTVNGTTGLATFGDDAGNQSTIAGKTATFGKDTGDQTVITGGVITAKSLNVDAFATKSITADDEIKVGTKVSLNKDGVLNLGTNKLTDDQLGNINATIKDGQVLEANSGSIGGVKFSATGEVSDVKNITAEKGTIGQVGLEGGKVTAANGGTIGGVNFAAGGKISDVSEITATTIKDGAGTIITGGNVESKTAKIGAIRINNETIEGSTANGLKIEGVQINDGVVSGVKSLTADTATIGGVNILDNNGLKVATGSKIQVGTNTIIEDGKLAVSTNTNLTDQSLTINATNTWTQTGGLVADKASVNGVVLGADATKGKATFTDASGKVTTISGDTITTGTITADELLVDKISLGKDPSNKNITIDKNGNIETKGKITIKDATGATVSEFAQDKATFGKDDANKTIIENGKINAKAKDNSDQQSEFNFDENGLTVSGQNASGKTSSFGFNAQSGAGTFTGQDYTTTTINGSIITSKISDADNSVLNGGKLDVTKNGKTTTIEGGVITTDTLKVNDIILGGNLYDADGKQLDGKLSIGNDGHLRAANGNFDVTADGSFTNKVGNTTLATTADSAGMSNEKTTSNVSVKNDISVSENGTKMSTSTTTKDLSTGTTTTVENASVETSNANGGTTTITGGTQTVTTTSDGTVFENSGHNTAFGGGSQTTTIINGNEITTGKITTDQLVIKGNGQGEAAGAGSGSIALAGDGSLKSDINDGTNHTTFETSKTGTTTTVTDGTYNATNEVTAKKIGSVITDGTVEISQELNAETGKITNKAGDTSTELGNDGFAVKQNGYTDVNIANGDVSVTNKNTGKQVNLSDLGTLGDLNEEITSRDEYKQNSTAVGAINSVSGHLTDEVNRLDGRINDVSDRVNKVGAMAAAIASLKSIGYDPQAPSEFSIGLGQYKGETGVAMGFFHYPNKNFMINVSLSTAGGETMGGIGATWRFGHKSPQKLLNEQREAQAKKELAAAEKYQAAAKLAKEAQERAEYAAKLARQAQVSADNAKAAADATQAKHF